MYSFFYCWACFSDEKFLNQKHYKWKMSLSLFYEVTAGTMETLFDMQYQPLCLEKKRDNFKDLQLHSTHAKSEVLTVGLTRTWLSKLGGGKNPQDVFIDLEGAIEMTIQSKKAQRRYLGKMVLPKWCCRKYRRSISNLLKNMSKQLHCSNIIFDIVPYRHKPSSMRMLNCRVKLLQKIRR